MNYSIELSHPEATPIARGFSVACVDGVVTYFSNLIPFERHDENDKQARAFIMARLRVDSNLPVNSIAKALNVSRSTVMQHCKNYREFGRAWFFKARKQRRRSAIDSATKEQAESLLAQGVSASQAASQLNVARATLTENIRAGKIKKPGSKLRSSSETQGASHRTERDVRDQSASMGRAATNVAGRTLALTGALAEVTPSFDQSAYAVERGGVLAALPMLLKEGILTAPLRLPNGYYGLSSILLFASLMCMARVRNPEQLRYDAPGEWGQILGLDRCPEVKTLRSKLSLLSEDIDKVHGWQQALSKKWLNDDCSGAATLLIDGHVKVYSGTKGRVPKKFVPRQKLCLPATVSYWVNVLGAQPLLCLHQDYDPGLVSALEHDVVKELHAIGVASSEAPDLTVADSNAEPLVTLVFDREGWSPDLFKRLARKGIACITWQKNFNEPRWDDDEFRSTAVTIHGPAQTHEQTVLIGEKSLKLKNKLQVRQIRRRLDCGREVAIVTTHPSISTEQVAGSMFSRWSQENFFKYMRDEFNVDALNTHALEPVDENTLVVNPRWRANEKLIGKFLGRLKTVRNQQAKCAGNDAKAARQLKLAQEVQMLEGQLEEVRLEKKHTAKHVRAGDLDEAQRLDALPKAQRLFIDIIRMIAYRAETCMVPAVANAQGKKANPRKALQTLFSTDANIIPDHENRILKVQILGSGSRCVDRALAPLLDELTTTETVYPGTDLKLVYELTANHCEAN